MTSISDLLKQREALAAQQAEIEKSLKELQLVERNATIEKVRALMAEYGLTVVDIAATTRKPRGPNKTKVDEGHVTKTVAAKYRHPSSGASWSGRGLKPKWLAAELDGGAKLTDFLISPL